MKLYYLGPEGSYSYLAAKQIIKKEMSISTLEAVTTISAIFQNVMVHSDAVGVVPLENTTSGDVYDTYKYLFENDVQVVADVIIPIKHALIVNELATIHDIEIIYSHPQALMQISEFTKKIGVQTIATNSTSEACMLVLQKNTKHVAAVAQAEAIAQIEQLRILPLEIANHANNYTRFLVITKSSLKQLVGTELFVIFSLKNDKPGGLTMILTLFAEKGINLKSIKSRPIEGAHFQYFFIVEAFCAHMDYLEHQKLQMLLQIHTQDLMYSVHGKDGSLCKNMD